MRSFMCQHIHQFHAVKALRLLTAAICMLHREASHTVDDSRLPCLLGRSEGKVLLLASVHDTYPIPRQQHT